MWCDVMIIIKLVLICDGKIIDPYKIKNIY